MGSTKFIWFGGTIDVEGGLRPWKILCWFAVSCVLLYKKALWNEEKPESGVFTCAH